MEKNTYCQKHTDWSKNIGIAMVIVFICITIFSMLIYFYTVNDSFQEKSSLLKQELTNQIGLTYEMTFSSVNSHVSTTAGFSQQLEKIIEFYNRSYTAEENVVMLMDIQKFLQNILLVNDFYYSVYLYLPKSKQVFSSDPFFGFQNNLDSFVEKELFQNANNSDKILAIPHIIHHNTPGSSVQVVTIIRKGMLKQTQKEAYLAVNIDVVRLHNYIFHTKNFNLSNTGNYFLYFRDSDHIFISKDSSLNNTQAKPYLDKSKKEKTTYDSKLGWNLVIEWDKSDSAILKPFPILFICGMSLFGLGICLLVMIRYTKPVNLLVSQAYQARWREALNNGSLEQLRELEDGKQYLGKSICAVTFTAVDYSEKERTHVRLPECLKEYLENKHIPARIIPINAERLTALLLIEKDHEPDQTLYGKLEDEMFAFILYFKRNYGQKLLCGISEVHDGKEMDSAYLESTQVFYYRMLLGEGPVLVYRNDIKYGNQTFEFPFAEHHRFLNCLVLGKKEECLQYIENLYGDFVNPAYALDDDQIFKYIYYTHSSILQQLLSSQYPFAIRIRSHLNTSRASLRIMQDELTDCIEEICTLIHSGSVPETGEISLSVIQYVHEHYENPDFCMSMAVDHFHLNRNIIGRIVREETNCSFNEYVNLLRIKKAGDLLVQSDRSIEKIAMECGFRSSAYFIKRFKDSTGVTPGKYRESRG